MKSSFSILFVFLFSFSFGTSDSIPASRKYWTGGIIVAGSGASVWALNEAWYAQYPRTGFHFFNDNNEWLGLDKTGHFLTSFHIGQFGNTLFTWSGMNKRSSLWWGGNLGCLYLTMIEMLDGFSDGWGFSIGDAGANMAGSLSFIAQQYYWGDARITPKFSAHLTGYADLRPELLGETAAERILKDYNGQTYWLSVNLHSFFPNSRIPAWTNVALGYSGKGMISGRPNGAGPERYSECLLSLDVDLWRIKGIEGTWLGKVLHSFGFIKFPFPAMIFNKHGMDFDPFYF